MKNAPMPLAIGIDIVELDRVHNIRFLRRFAEYFLTPAELRFFEKDIDPVRFIASRFAAKEAMIKAFPGLLKPHEFEIVKHGVKPSVKFLAPAIRKRYRAVTSISHSTHYAAGYAMIMER